MSERRVNEDEEVFMLLTSGEATLVVLGVTLAAVIFSVLLAVHVGNGSQAPRVMELRLTADGFSPATLEMRAGEPIELRVSRTDPGACTDSVVLDGLGVDKKLTTNATTSIGLTPEREGTYAMHCGMGCLKGTIKVRGFGREVSRVTHQPS